MTETIKLRCYRCRLTPDKIEEYIEGAKDEGITPDEFVKKEEGTYNESNGHFCCTDCYIEIGMPATAPGAETRWIAP